MADPDQPTESVWHQVNVCAGPWENLLFGNLGFSFGLFHNPHGHCITVLAERPLTGTKLKRMAYSPVIEPHPTDASDNPEFFCSRTRGVQYADEAFGFPRAPLSGLEYWAIDP